MKHIKDIEKSIYSQNNEDGIAEYLINLIDTPNKHLLEIGSGNGQNNSSFLCEYYNYTGVTVDAIFGAQNNKQSSIHLKQFVNKNNVIDIINVLPDLILDYMSIDIDGMDFYIVKELFKYRVKPKIIVVEYNYAFGPSLSMTIKYKEDFSRSINNALINSSRNEKKMIAKHFYGVSYLGWINYFKTEGYEFFTTESHGVNMFFYDPQHINVGNIKTTGYLPNSHFKIRWGLHEELFPVIKKHCSELFVNIH